MWKLKNRYNNKGFTITELAITMGIIVTLSGIGVVGLSKLMATNRQTQCVNNLREISQGLQFYHNDLRTFPEDGYPYDKTKDPLPLSTELASYIKVKSIFVCPQDEEATSTSDFASYDPYYVARPDSYQNEELVIGCPRHRDASNSTSLFSMGSTEITDIDTVLANRGGDEQAIPPDGTKADRTISNNNDVMTFADGSTVTLKNAAGSGCFLVQSVRLADGTLYSIVRLQDNGKIDVDVTTGSKFEIVTPSAVVGVRGTQFTVETSKGGYTTKVTLTSGTVILMDRITGETTTLTDGVGGITVASAVVNMHDHSHWHADGTYHNHNHPNLNQAHHGNPALAMKVAAAAGGGGGGGEVDGDLDGYTTSQGDCNDSDPNVNPRATEILGNLIDDDCNYLTADNASDQALIDIINDPTKTDWEVENALYTAAGANPGLSDAVFLAVLNRNPPLLPSSRYENILSWDEVIPLSDTVLLEVTSKPTIMGSSSYGWVLYRSIPLSDTVMVAAINQVGIINPMDLGWVLTENTLINPLSDTVLLAAINQGSAIMAPWDFEAVLTNSNPLSDNVLTAAINKGTIMDTGYYKIVLGNNSPLSEGVLNTLANSDTTMISSDVKSTFNDNNPLSEGVLNSMINKDTLMISSDYKDVLVNNSPLSQSIVDQINAGIPTTMISSDRQAVLDAQ
jgi:Tfp pilus assembly protein FimT